MSKYRCRIRLRSFLCVVAGLCFVLGVLVKPYWDRHQILRAIEHEGGTVYSFDVLVSPDEPSRIVSQLAVDLNLAPVSIEFRHRTISKGAAKSIAKLGEIDEIRYYPTSRTNWESLSCLRQVSSLYVDDADDQMLQSLGQLEGLKELTIQGRTFTGSSLSTLARFDELKILDLSYTGITDHAMEYIGKITSLEELYLAGTSISDFGVAELKGLSQLRILYLDETNISSSCLKHLAELAGLVELHLDCLALHYDDTADLLELAKIRGLRVLETGSLVVDDRGDPEIKEAFPDCELVYSFTYSRDHLIQFPMTEERSRKMRQAIDDAEKRGENPFDTVFGDF